MPASIAVVQINLPFTYMKAACTSMQSSSNIVPIPIATRLLDTCIPVYLYTGDTWMPGSRRIHLQLKGSHRIEDLELDLGSELGFG